MKYDIYGVKIVEVIRQENGWRAYYCGNEGKKRLADDIRIPATLAAEDVGAYLADIFHEYASPGRDQVQALSVK